MEKVTIAAITNEYQYKEKFEEQDSVAVCLKQSDPYFGPTTKLDCIVIDGNLILSNELPKIRAEYKETPIFYVMPPITSQVRMQNIQVVCSGYDIEPLSDQLTINQVVSKVLAFFGKESGSARIFSFFGTNPGVGVSTVVLNVAEVLSKNSKESVLVLSLNPWDPSDYFIDYQGHYLNDLKIDLKQKTLTPEKLQKHAYKSGHFWHLAGNRDIKLQRYFQVNEIEHLIEVARNTFDVILIDAGAHFDNACYAQAFVSADLKFLVTTQDDKGYRSYYPLVFQQLIEPLKGQSQDFILLLNQFKPNYSLISEKDLQEELEMSLLATIPDCDVAGQLAIRQKKLLVDISDNEFSKAIKTIGQTIFKKARLTLNESNTVVEERKGLFGSFFKKREEQPWL